MGDNNVTVRLRHWSLIVILVLSGLSSPAKSQDPHDVVQEEFGKEYHIARRQLIKKGNIPLDQSRAADRACEGNPPACSMYPELIACAVDQGLCRFEWRSKNGRRFYIITRGEDPNNLVVHGMDYE
jgi:hypothetical protein